MNSKWGSLVRVVVLLTVFNIKEIRCGKSELKLHGGRAIGGTSASSSEYPFQVSLQLRGSHICGGALITMKHVLTVAHCVYELNANGNNELIDLSNLQAVAGTWDKLNCNPKGQTRQAIEITAHEGYSTDKESMNHDIAIIRVLEEFYFTPEIMPIALHEVNTTEREICYSSGWGVTHSHGLVSRYLSQVALPVWSHKRCKMRYGSGLTDNMLCAGSGHKRDVCQGESGAPLVCEGELAGLVSWGFGCISSTFPVIFTNVTQYIEWIEDVAYSSATISRTSIPYTLMILLTIFLNR